MTILGAPCNKQHLKKAAPDTKKEQETGGLREMLKYVQPNTATKNMQKYIRNFIQFNKSFSDNVKTDICKKFLKQSEKQSLY